MTACWHYLDDKRLPQGPYSRGQLKKLFLKEVLDAESLVWNGQDIGEWTKLRDVAQLYRFVTSPKKLPITVKSPSLSDSLSQYSPSSSSQELDAPPSKRPRPSPLPASFRLERTPSPFRVAGISALDISSMRAEAAESQCSHRKEEEVEEDDEYKSESHEVCDDFGDDGEIESEFESDFEEDSDFDAEHNRNDTGATTLWKREVGDDHKHDSAVISCVDDSSSSGFFTGDLGASECATPYKKSSKKGSDEIGSQFQSYSRTMYKRDTLSHSHDIEEIIKRTMDSRDKSGSTLRYVSKKTKSSQKTRSISRVSSASSILLTDASDSQEINDISPSDDSVEDTHKIAARPLLEDRHSLPCGWQPQDQSHQRRQTPPRPRLVERSSTPVPSMRDSSSRRKTESPPIKRRMHSPATSKMETPVPSDCFQAATFQPPSFQPPIALVARHSDDWIIEQMPEVKPTLVKGRTMPVGLSRGKRMTPPPSAGFRMSPPFRGGIPPPPSGAFHMSPPLRGAVPTLPSGNPLMAAMHSAPHTSSRDRSATLPQSRATAAWSGRGHMQSPPMAQVPFVRRSMTPEASHRRSGRMEAPMHIPRFSLPPQMGGGGFVYMESPPLMMVTPSPPLSARTSSPSSSGRMAPPLPLSGRIASSPSTGRMASSPSTGRTTPPLSGIIGRMASAPSPLTGRMIPPPPATTGRRVSPSFPIGDPMMHHMFVPRYSDARSATRSLTSSARSSEPPSAEETKTEPPLSRTCSKKQPMPASARRKKPKPKRSKKAKKKAARIYTPKRFATRTELTAAESNGLEDTTAVAKKGSGSRKFARRKVRKMAKRNPRLADELVEDFLFYVEALEEEKEKVLQLINSKFVGFQKQIHAAMSECRSEWGQLAEEFRTPPKASVRESRLSRRSRLARAKSRPMAGRRDTAPMCDRMEAISLQPTFGRILKRVGKMQAMT